MMNKELILKLIARAKESADNAYCPYTNQAVGCSLLANENIVFGGCNIESNELSYSMGAGEVAILKAISDGSTSFKAICLYSATRMPYPSGRVYQLLAERNNMMINIVLATDATYVLHTLVELFPFPPEGPEID